MKLYDSVRAPNPRRVRLFLKEKGIEIPRVTIDLGAFEHRETPFTKVNPLQRTPALALEDGTVITESVAICRYFEEIQPEPNLFGRTPLERALVEMWNRRVELELFIPITHIFRHGHPGMAKHEVPQVADWAEVNRPKVMQGLALLDEQLSKTPFLAGDAFSIADITALCAIDFMKPTKTRVPDEMTALLRWHHAVSSRPSATA
jgi:glutathione S-transferase